jgi:hypothetical protein
MLHSVRDPGDDSWTVAIPMQTHTSLSRDLGLALAQVHWDRTCPEPVDDEQSSLPVTELDLHVTGRAGSRPDPVRQLLTLLRHIARSGRDHLTPIERDHLAGYLGQIVAGFAAGAGESLTER